MTGTPQIVKCLVWDLDNTLWQGTLSEGDDVQVGSDIRSVVELLDSRGILQSVASKNDHDAAWDRLTELGLAKYFVLPKITWGPKSESIRALAEELNFAHDVIAFIDDRPAELAEVEFHLPRVRRYAADTAAALPERPEFSPTVLTVDARRRREMYQASFTRDIARETFSGTDEEFLRTLAIAVRVERADEESISRVEELTLRTSQMNATGIPYAEDELRRYCADPRHEVLVATMSDKFGHYGAIGVALVERWDEAWRLKLLATSCRVVSFGIGGRIIEWLADQAARADRHLLADFRATERNRMMEIAYRFAGFTDEPCSCDRVAADPTIQRLHLMPRTVERVPVIWPEGVDLNAS